jgi:hypothetical protein
MKLSRIKYQKEKFIWLFIFFRIFVADTLNFSFWSSDEKKKYMVRYKGKEYTGYWSWIAAFNRALDVCGLQMNIYKISWVLFS